MAIPELPLELYDEIIDHIDPSKYRSTLRSCARVCSVFRVFAQRRLFSTILFRLGNYVRRHRRSDHVLRKRDERVLNAMLSNPVLANNVRHIIFNCNAYTRADMGQVLLGQALARLGPSLRNIRKLTFRNCQSSHLLTCCVPFFDAISCHHGLESVKFVAVRELHSHYITAFPNVREISFDYCSIVDWSWQPYEIDPARFHSLCIREPEPSLLKFLFQPYRESKIVNLDVNFSLNLIQDIDIVELSSLTSLTFEYDKVSSLDHIASIQSLPYLEYLEHLCIKIPWWALDEFRRYYFGKCLQPGCGRTHAIAIDLYRHLKLQPCLEFIHSIADSLTRLRTFTLELPYTLLYEWYECTRRALTMILEAALRDLTDRRVRMIVRQEDGDSN